MTEVSAANRWARAIAFDASTIRRGFAILRRSQRLVRRTPYRRSDQSTMGSSMDIRISTRFSVKGNRHQRDSACENSANGHQTGIGKLVDDGKQVGFEALAIHVVFLEQAAVGKLQVGIAGKQRPEPCADRVQTEISFACGIEDNRLVAGHLHQRMGRRPNLAGQADAAIIGIQGAANGVCRT